MAGARTKAEFADLCGVSQAAISQAIDRGRIWVKRNGRIDPARAENVAYIESLKARGIEPGKPRPKPVRNPNPPANVGRPKKIRTPEAPPQAMWTKTDADIAKAQAQTAKIHMEIAQRMGVLLLAEEVERCFGDIYSAFSNHVLTFGQRVAPIICSSLGATGAEVSLTVQKILDDEHERILEDVRRATVEGLRERRHAVATDDAESDE